ncbi:MAG TPA: transporter substrate-binding domain-containing protein [Rectinemataceae bacterium]|nr:transporter substrate-binding domain-containing protein [Rectinemataceae bacterium]
MKKLLLSIAFVALAAALFAAPTTLAIGWTEYPPFQISDKAGLDVELAQAVFTQAGYTLDFQHLPWARQLGNLEAGTLNVVLSASKNAERAKYAEWSSGYRQERNDLLTLVTSKATVTSLKSLIGTKVKIGAQRGSFYGAEFETLAKDPGFAALLELVPDPATSLNKMEAGRLDFYVDDIVAATYAIKTNKLPTQVKVALKINGDDVYFMIGKKTLAADPALMDKVNKAIATLSANGTFTTIYAKYGIVK